MKSYKEWLIERAGGGAEAGKLEIIKISDDTAYEYAKTVLGDKLNEIQGFLSNFRLAQKMAKRGWTLRRDMPVITSRDVHEFQNKLQSGFIDIRKPFAATTKPGNPFPDGIAGDAAKQWLEAGLKIHDGSESDDKVRVEKRQIAVKELIPIQKQIYFDKAIESLARDSFDSTKIFLTTQTFFIASSDNYIIDGHHRYLAAMLMNPNMKVNILAIDLPISTLLPLARTYGDAIGNKRNK